MEDRDIVLYNEKDNSGQTTEEPILPDSDDKEYVPAAEPAEQVPQALSPGPLSDHEPEAELVEKNTGPALIRMKVTGLLSAFIVLALLAAMVVIPDRAFSEKENRSLAGVPAFSATSVASGKFTTDMDNYTADQFPLRDMWISLRTDFERLIGHSCINGVYIGADDYLLEDVTVQDDETLQKRLDSMNCLADNVDGTPVFTMIIPNAASVLPEKLPANAPVGDQDAWLDSLYAGLDPGITVIDVRDVFAEKKDQGLQLYYRTDHHWTTDAAKLALDYSAPYLDIADYSEDIFDSYAISNEFQGTLVSKTGCTDITPDVIRAYMLRSGCEVPYLVENVEKEETTASVYVPEKLETTDKYAVFFGGNYPLLHITTTAPSGKKILIFKDSYANCFTPFLIPYFSEIFMVDARYCNEDVYALIKENRVDKILFLYNASTFAEDSSIDGILAVPEGSALQS